MLLLVGAAMLTYVARVRTASSFAPTTSETDKRNDFRRHVMQKKCDYTLWEQYFEE